MMPTAAIERALQRAFGSVTGPSTPPRLRDAMEHAVFAGGGRVRPQLVLGIAQAHGRWDEAMAEAGAVAVELLHCASLVHDDLPCFDDAPLRRGKPTVHRRFGEALAVLAGDALIVAAFDVVARAGAIRPSSLPPVLTALTTGVGAVRGLVAGQAWESESEADLGTYHRAKTGALFEAAACIGATAGGSPPHRWRELGLALGEAYQIADDIMDLVGTPTTLGKPVARDMVLGRPSAALQLGMAGARQRLQAVLSRLPLAVPPCPGRDELRAWITSFAGRLYESLAPALDGLAPCTVASPMSA